MSDYLSNTDLASIAKMLAGDAKRIVLTTHAKPDGDAFGSVAALSQALRWQGHTVDALLMPPVPATFDDLLGRPVTSDYNEGMILPEPDFVFILDTGAWSQLGPLRGFLEKHLQRTIIMDHHLNGDVPARYRYIDGQAAAACEIVADLIDAMQVPYDDVMAQSIFVGIASDTGWFRYSNTRPHTHELAARLLQHGIDHAALFEHLEHSEREEKLALMNRALDSLELIKDEETGREMAVMTLIARDFAETGATLEETERLVNLPMSIGKVDASVLITEPPATQQFAGKGSQAIRLSFRSKPREGAVNVAQLAQQFGGGGHARAAGAKVEQPLADVAKRIREAAKKLHEYAQE